MPETTTTIRDIQHHAQGAHDALREVMWRLDGHHDSDTVADALSDLAEAAHEIEAAALAAREVLDQRGYVL